MGGGFEIRHWHALLDGAGDLALGVALDAEMHDGAGVGVLDAGLELGTCHGSGTGLVADLGGNAIPRRPRRRFNSLRIRGGVLHAFN